ncbi:unnamed protein product [Absidia cylindrospora]
MHSRYYHELDHMKNASQRPSPSSSLEHSTTKSSGLSPLPTDTHSPSLSTSKVKTAYFDRNDGGWLESSHVQRSATTSHSSTCQNLQHNESATTSEGSTKDLLDTVSNYDILRLTQLTNKLPVVSNKRNHIPKGHKQTKHRQDMEDDASLQHQGESSDISNDPRHIDTGLTNLLNQDFMRTPPVSDTDYSALLTVPSCNTSTISTDSDDSQFSWHNTSNRHPKQSPALTKVLSDQTTRTVPADKTRPYHPLTISTTAPYTESDLTPSSSQNSHNSKRRSWYKSFMKRDKKGKFKGNNSPMINIDEPDLHTGYDADELSSSNIQHEPTIIESNTEYHNLQSRTHPMVDTTTNYLIPPSTRTKLRLPSRHKRQSSFGIRNDSSSDKATPSEDNQTRQRKLYVRRHSFDNILDYGLPSQGTNSPLDLTTTAAEKRGQDHGDFTSSNVYLNNHGVITSGTTTSQMSSTSSIASSTFSFSTSSPPQPHIPSSNIPPLDASSNGNYSPRDNNSTVALGTSKKDPDDINSNDNDSDRHATDASLHQPVIEITPSILQQEENQQHQRNQPPQRDFYFDYDSLPWENMRGEPQGVKALVKKMVDNGYGKMTETQIIHDGDHEDDNSDDDDLVSTLDDDDNGGGDCIVDKGGGGNDGSNHMHKTVGEKDDGAIPTIEFSNVIGGDAYYSWVNRRRLSNVNVGTRCIAEIHIAVENDTGFYKLTQLAEETMLIKGRLLNLFVSFVVPSKMDIDIASNLQENSILSQNANDRLLSLDPFIDNAKLFLNERAQGYRAFASTDDSINNTQHRQQRRPGQYYGSRKNFDSNSEAGVNCTNNSSCSLSSISSIASILSSTSASKNQQSVTPATAEATATSPLSSFHSNRSSTFLQSLWSYVPNREYNTYEYRQDQLRNAVSDLRRGMDEFKRSLEDTENMVHSVKIDMNDTKAKMDIYLKDVPETHYSELKRLEVSIESILANRAKSRGMELLYWLLTALLTGCAFLLWAVIWALKCGQTVISFPGKMIKAFNEHMEERNKVVKQVGMRIVAKDADRPSVSSSMDQPQSPSHDTTINPDLDTPSMDVHLGSNPR